MGKSLKEAFEILGLGTIGLQGNNLVRCMNVENAFGESYGGIGSIKNNTSIDSENNSDRIRRRDGVYVV